MNYVAGTTELVDMEIPFFHLNDIMEQHNNPNHSALQKSKNIPKRARKIRESSFEEQKGLDEKDVVLMTSGHREEGHAVRETRQEREEAVSGDGDADGSRGQGRVMRALSFDVAITSVNNSGKTVLSQESEIQPNQQELQDDETKISESPLKRIKREEDVKEVKHEEAVQDMDSDTVPHLTMSVAFEEESLRATSIENEVSDGNVDILAKNVAVKVEVSDIGDTVDTAIPCAGENGTVVSMRHTVNETVVGMEACMDGAEIDNVTAGVDCVKDEDGKHNTIVKENTTILQEVKTKDTDEVLHAQMEVDESITQSINPSSIEDNTLGVSMEEYEENGVVNKQSKIAESKLFIYDPPFYYNHTQNRLTVDGRRQMCSHLQLTSKCNKSCNCAFQVDFQERQVHPWSDMEKCIFVDKFLQYPKNFNKISSYLKNSKY